MAHCFKPFGAPNVAYSIAREDSFKQALESGKGDARDGSAWVMGKTAMCILGVAGVARAVEMHPWGDGGTSVHVLNWTRLERR